jgi:nucleoside-diphosphate-sugar epimerase
VTRPLPRTVLVTGATGFLGSHVSAALVARGVAVRGLVRRPDAPLPARVEPAYARGLDDREGIAATLRGVEGVIHLAARVHQPAAPGDEAAFRAINVEGTRLLLEEALAAGVRDFVFASSVKVVGERSETPWDEATPPAPVDAYGVTKLECEAMVRSLGEGAGVHTPILRLPLVYGPGMKGNALRLFRLVDQGLPLPLGSARNRRSLLFTGNLVAAVFATLESPSGSDTFFVTDAEAPSTPELVTAIARALGRPARLLPFPVPLLQALGRAGDLVARAIPFPLTNEAVDRLVGSLEVDGSRLARRTGYTRPYTLAEGLRITAEWYRCRSRASR